MAKERGVFQIIFKQFIGSLKPTFLRPKLIGEDYYGTKYYEKPLPSNKKGRPSRYFVPKVKDQFDQDLPAEWESWLRYRRKTPPTTEELEENYRISMMKKKNASQLEESMHGKDHSGGELGAQSQNNRSISFPVYKDYSRHDK